MPCHARPGNPDTIRGRDGATFSPALPLSPNDLEFNKSSALLGSEKGRDPFGIFRLRDPSHFKVAWLVDYLVVWDLLSSYIVGQCQNATHPIYD